MADEDDAPPMRVTEVKPEPILESKAERFEQNQVKCWKVACAHCGRHLFTSEIRPAVCAICGKVTKMVAPEDKPAS
jgi:hypothetical protein